MEEQRKSGEENNNKWGQGKQYQSEAGWRPGGGGQEAVGGEVNVFRGAMGCRDNKRKKRQRMRAAAATAAAGLCNINRRQGDQKAGELNCVSAESRRWREFFLS